VPLQEETGFAYATGPPPTSRHANLGRLELALESESLYILKTALLVEDLFESPGKLSDLALDQLDYTPTVMGLAKVFERESNLSLVHWLRSQLGITLPEFFTKYQPNVKALFTPKRANSRPIDFNKETRGRWLPPLMGESELTCEEFGKKHLPRDWDRPSWRRLMKNWDVIRIGRNQAAHTEFVTKDSAARLRRAIDELAENQIFDKMRSLKVMYRGF
jgi:hypothetical protein